MNNMTPWRTAHPQLAKNLINHFVGFSDVFDSLDRALSKADNSINFPPRNIIRYEDDSWEIQYAVAGFKRDELSVKIEKETQLVVSGKVADQPVAGEYLQRGIALREFSHEITIPEGAKVSVELEDGLLKVMVVKPIKKEPEPRLIQIK